VAYCLGITKIDPIKYDLLFERFLNPDRISLPDIDTDFDDDGRGKVLEWVEDKYGHDKVAHIITYGTMATKNSIKDVARVEKLPLDVSNRLCKAIPDKLKLSVVVVAEQILIPFDGFPCSCYVVLQNLRRHFAGYTCRADDKVLMILFQVLAVSTRTHVIAVHPCARHQLDEVLVSVVVLGEDDEVIASHVAFLLHTV
jgi:hypothetical protein